MPISIRDDAIVLTRLEYSETSQILVLLTRKHGKVRAIAKGIQRGTKNRFAVGADLLEIGTLVLSARHEGAESLATLIEWRQTRSLSGLRESLIRLNAALYAAEITSLLIMDWDRHEGLFEALSATLASMSDSNEPIAILIGYQISLLGMVGLLPRFDACVSCGRTVDLTHFSSFEGGMICKHCEQHLVEKREVSAATLHFLQGLVAVERDPATSQPEITPNAERVAGPAALLNYHISHLAGREPRLAPLVLERLRGTRRH